MSQTLNLLYGFAPPAVVYITEDSSKPVNNTLTFDIGNPSDSALVKMENPDKLGPDSNIPNYGSQDPQVNLSRFYIWFPYAKDAADAEPQDIATDSDAANIEVSPGPINTSWNVVKKTSSSIGTYWTLFPKESTVLDPQQSVAFIISELVSQTPAGSMSWMYVQAVDIPGYEESTHEVQLYKEPPQLAITAFDLSDQVIYEGGTTNMTWSTVNADYVIATPAIDPQNPGKRYPANNLKPGVTVNPALSTTEYTLTAYDEQGEHVTSQPLNISVLPLEITSLEASNTEAVVNEVVMVSWQSENATSAQINLPPPYGLNISVNDNRLFLVQESITVELTVSNGFTQLSQELKINAENKVPAGDKIIPALPSAINGGDGANGSPGFSGRSGEPGGNGADGEYGAPGMNGMQQNMVKYQLPVTAKSGYAIFEMQGQEGGNGGNGGNGGDGGQGSPAGAGGNGGKGGNGGNAGDGGVLELLYDSKTTMPSPIYVNLGPASGGKGGKGGKGGAGSPNGADGSNGQDGESGKPGYLIIQKTDEDS